jgi:transposase InsO family protein
LPESASRPDARARDLTIVAEMKTISDEFEAYGYRRVDAELRHRGIVVNAKEIRRLMREHALNPKQRRRFVATADSDHNYPSESAWLNSWCWRAARCVRSPTGNLSRSTLDARSRTPRAPPSRSLPFPAR